VYRCGCSDSFAVTGGFCGEVKLEIVRISVYFSAQNAPVGSNVATFLPPDAYCGGAAFATATCLSVCLSVCLSL